MIKNALGYLSLFRALYFAKRADALRARIQFATAMARLQITPEFADAFDARISIIQGRGDDAQLKLKTSVNALNSRSDENARYISLYCQHFLALYQRSSQARDSKLEALSLSPSGYLHHFLPFLGDEAVSRIVDEKGATPRLES